MITQTDVKNSRRTVWIKIDCQDCGKQVSVRKKRNAFGQYGKVRCRECARKHNNRGRTLQPVARKEGDPVYGQCGVPTCAGFKAQTAGKAQEGDTLCTACSTGLHIHNNRDRNVGMSGTGWRL